MMKNNNLEIISNDIIKQLDKIITSSYKPWISPDQLIPVRYTTNEKFGGNNALYLLNKQQTLGFKDNRWLTEKEINKIEGAELKPDVTPLKIPFVVSNAGITKVIPLNIYNVAQVNNLSLDRIENQPWKDVEVIEDLLLQTGAKIEHILSDFAGYDFRKDTILMPAKEQFPSEGAYYNTVLHELQHWTGHEDRLNRLPSKDNQEYAREEIVAEIGNMLLQQELGVKAIQANSQYRAKIKEELQDYLNNDPKEILPAVKKAQQSVDFILNSANQKQNLQEDLKEKQPKSLSGEIDKILFNFKNIQNDAPSSNNIKEDKVAKRGLRK
ncbi:zincin-like metallopeptidase domain-containing protein [Commensalibacter nepenthis]|uniref:Zincin-like metallopeptidase domain-containing protein n=1 Tax=Commensalibacter nepenthis TaxID=3043872 RepID=A0ABT6QAE1_9PROT|nr:zincin-like metallopeptidase domain-containing protein [Commensalibacter sp. TBRC 10068]MDI2113876.1 zincin-like metallopeptidase domain-containing protein [Commensalibacter sp. TBRC 10068]